MPEIIKRRDAALQGLKFFFSGRPCLRGHVAKRYVSCGACVDCDREKQREFRKSVLHHRATVEPGLVSWVAHVHPDDVDELTALVNALRLARGLPVMGAPVRPPELSPAEIFAERCRILGTSVVLAEYKRSGRPIPENVPQFATPEPETGNHWPTHDPY